MNIFERSIRYIKFIFGIGYEPMPHEIFPELLEWQPEDIIEVRGFNYEMITESSYFVGILNGKVHLKLRYAYKGVHMVELSPQQAMRNTFNKTLRGRQSSLLEQQVKLGIKNDQYNEFLKVIREFRDKTYEEWRPKLQGKQYDNRTR